MKGYHIRGIKEEVIERMRVFLIQKYGTFFRHEGEIISDALADYLNRVQHSTWTDMVSRPVLRPDVRTKIEKIKKYINVNGIERFSFNDLFLAISYATSVKDRRTINRYIKLLLELGIIKHSGLLYEVNKGADEGQRDIEKEVSIYEERGN